MQSTLISSLTFIVIIITTTINFIPLSLAAAASRRFTPSSWAPTFIHQNQNHPRRRILFGCNINIMKSSARGARSTRSLSATTKRKSPYYDEGDDDTTAATIPKGTVGASSAIKSKRKQGELIKTAKRKASSSSKSPSSSSSSSKKKKKKKPSTVVKVERTQSFEPAWWGNVIAATSINKLHSHASTCNSTPTTKQSSNDTITTNSSTNNFTLSTSSYSYIRYTSIHCIIRIKSNVWSSIKCILVHCR